MIISGIDESGRGALIGPMVISGVSIDQKDEKKLKLHGVKDSKKLSPMMREKLAKVIEKVAKDIVVIRVQACKIDDYRARGINLDKIEAIKMAEIIKIINSERIYIDSLEANPSKFKQMILKNLEPNGTELIVENYADETYTAVSAASIIAKVHRDNAIKEIKERVNFDFGVGYSHDKRTIEFVQMLVKKHKGDLPPYVRKSWITTQDLLEKSFQKKVKEFIFRKKEDCKEEKDEEN